MFCIDDYRKYVGEVFSKINEVFFGSKNKKVEIILILIEKFKNRNENPDFEQKLLF